MTAPAPPSVERVLRSVFWKLLFRGRAATQVAAHRKRKQMSLTLTVVLYGLFGLMPALMAFGLDAFAFASLLHAFTFLFASLTLAGNAGTKLFMREEAEILLHRPVRPEQLLRAKSFVLVAFALILAGALNTIGLVTGFWSKGSTWAFAPAHAVSTLLLMVFSAALIVLVYNLCLKWFPRERFENLLTMLQTLLVVVMVTSGQLMPRLIDMEALQQFDPTHGWGLLLPPVWFGALDVLLSGALPWSKVWLPALLAVSATALTVWLAFVRLGSAYGIGLMALTEGPTVALDKLRRRLLPRLVHLAPLRWWLRDPVERQSFLLTSAYLARDRETKLKLYPSIVPFVILPLVMTLGVGSRRHAGASTFMDSMAVGYLAVVPIQALMLLRRSEHWRAASLFAQAPLAHWTPLFHGARKAVLWWLTFPLVLALGGVLALVRGSWSPFAPVLSQLVLLPVYSLVPGLFAPWLPLSQPNQEQRDAGMGCLVIGSVIMVAMASGGLAAWMDELGWWWPFLGIEAATAFGLQALLLAKMRASRWNPAVDPTDRRRRWFGRPAQA